MFSRQNYEVPPRISTIERNYEVALNPSRFEIVQRQIECSKYLDTENAYYVDRFPKGKAPVPSAYLSGLEKNHDDVHDNLYASLEPVEYRRIK